MNITLENMAYISFLFRNDLHFLHHNVRGESFEETHKKFGEYYDNALEDMDFFSEHAVIKEIDIMPNFSNIHKTKAFEIWEKVESTAELDVEKAYNLFVSCGKDYLEALDLCREYCEENNWNDIVSSIDDIRGKWSIEIEYKGEKIRK